MDAHQIRDEVRRHYAAAAEQGGCDCGPCCGGSSTIVRLQETGDASSFLPAGADLGLSCGKPTQAAAFSLGETVLDLGSGAGADAFLAAQAVGPDGWVIGVDLTPEMIARARGLAAEKGYRNVEFRLGDIENLPGADSTADVILSNCVLNLVPDKNRAFAEMYRVLRPGGRFVVSDIVSRGQVPGAVRQDPMLWAGCLAGAIDQEAYLSSLRKAGFDDLQVLETRTYEGPEGGAYAFLSVTVRGWKK